MIRPALKSDIPQILEIWNYAIRETITTFNSQEKTVSELAALLKQKQVSNHPFIVAVDGEKLLGFATYGQFRGGVGYRMTVEHSIFLAEVARGQGLGRALLAELENSARASGIHSMFAGISGENTDAITFHTRLGYVNVARLPEVGHKFGRWFDLVLMQKIL